MQGFCLGDFRGGNSTPTLYDRVHCCLWGIVKLNDSKLNLQISKIALPVIFSLCGRG